jgi:hypothetical protein
MNKIFACLILTLLSANAAATFITASNVSSSGVHLTAAGANAVINDATDINYIAPNPSGGGGGTSTWVNQDFNTWTFNFDTAHTLNEIHLWTYYSHSPKDWNLTFFAGADASSSDLGSQAFSLGPEPACVNSVGQTRACSQLYTMSFSDFSDVKSLTLTNTSLSTDLDINNTGRSWYGGVGLAEVHFGGVAQNLAAVPEPSTLAVFALGLLGLASRRVKKQA